MDHLAQLPIQEKETTYYMNGFNFSDYYDIGWTMCKSPSRLLNMISSVNVEITLMTKIINYDNITFEKLNIEISDISFLKKYDYYLHDLHDVLTSEMGKLSLLKQKLDKRTWYSKFYKKYKIKTMTFM